MERNNALEGISPKRVILPRTRGYKHMGLATVFDRTLMDESGELAADIPAFAEAAEPTVFVTADPSWLLAILDNAFSEREDWQYAFSVITTEPVSGLETRRVKLRMFGLTGEGKRKRKMHQCWDPRTMSPMPLHKLIDGPVSHSTLMQWAHDIRAWAQAENLELKNAFAGYASQLLRDSRFYPNERRRVPRSTNERARGSLPGNLMRLYVPAGPRTYDVTAIDQRSAHHRIVQEIALPDANTLFARGYFNDPENADDFWAVKDTELFNRTISQPGLVYCGVSSRRTLTGEFRLPCQDFQGYSRIWIWTNLIPFMQSTGTTIEGIYAALTSTTMDKGLSRYGGWAQNQIENCTKERKLWLKPLLHSAYGLLAARPRPLVMGWRQAKKGKCVQFLFGAREFTGKRIRARKEFQPAFANVIQRGMIEAETQLRSILMARELTQAGCKVLHIHTDGLHVEGALPLLPDSWSINALTHVTYIDNVSWVSKERDCLPGRDAQARAELVKHYGRLHTTLSESSARRRLARLPFRAPR